MAKKPRMGRNLDALLGGSRNRASGADGQTQMAESDVAVDGSDETSNVTTLTPSVTLNADVATDDGDARQPGDKLRVLGVDQIRRGSYQPRRHFDPELLSELAESISSQGLIQPIIVRPDGTGSYELIAGERRWRACQLAGITELPAIVRELDDQSVAAASLIENIQRADLNPLEEAAALQRLCEEFDMTHAAVAESVGRSRAAVSNLMRLLDLHDEVKLMVDRGELDMGHARSLLGAPLAQQHELARRVIKQGLTVRATEKLVRELDQPPAASQSAAVSDPDIDALCRKLGETLGAPVRIQHTASGAGRLEIRYGSVAELEGVLKHIR